MYAKDKALEAIKKYKTRDPFDICRQRNIEIIYSDLEPDIRGIYQYYKRKRIIHLNSNLSIVEQRAVLAHELGHVDMHKNDNCIFLDRHTCNIKDVYEHEANVYAAELLLPDILPRHCWEYSYQQVAAAYGVPVELVMLKYRI